MNSSNDIQTGRTYDEISSENQILRKSLKNSKVDSENYTELNNFISKKK